MAGSEMLREDRATFLIVMLVLSLFTVSCSPPTTAMVNNRSAGKLSAVAITYNEFVATIKSLGPGESARVRLRPHGEAGSLFVSFNVDGKPYRQEAAEYFEDDGYRFVIDVMPDRRTEIKVSLVD